MSGAFGTVEMQRIHKLRTMEQELSAILTSSQLSKSERADVEGMLNRVQIKRLKIEISDIDKIGVI